MSSADSRASNTFPVTSALIKASVNWVKPQLASRQPTCSALSEARGTPVALFAYGTEMQHSRIHRINMYGGDHNIDFDKYADKGCMKENETRSAKGGITDKFSAMID